MGFIDKIKLLFKIHKPLGEVVKVAKDAGDSKRGWKTIGFWVTLAGTLLATAGALTGIIPPQAQLIATTIIQSIYNILRGAQNMDSPTVKGTLTMTEFWLTALTEAQKAVVAAHDGGVTGPAMEKALSTINLLSLAFGQNLATRTIAPVKK